MNIIIEEPLTKFAKSLYQGLHTRYASMTDVKWISKSKLIAAHRYAGKLYCIERSDTDYKILSQYTHKYRGELYQTEAIELNKEKNKIFLISFTPLLFILDIRTDNSIVCTKTIELNNTGIPYHGVRLFENNLYVTPSHTPVGFETIKKIDLDTLRITDISSLGNTVKVKHIAFLPNKTILVLIQYKSTTSLYNPNHISTGCLRLYDEGFTRVFHTLEIPLSQVDGMTIDDSTFYVTCRDLDHGYILQGHVLNNIIYMDKKIPCEDFPHGIDCLGNTLAYTSYSTSGIHILNV
jgi:hypothetical protein